MINDEYELANWLDSHDDDVHEPVDVLASGCMKMMIVFIIGIIDLALCGLFTSCTTTEYVVVPEYHTDTLIQTKVQKDSVYLHDSTYVEVAGDTVRIEKWHTQYVERQLHDTTYISKTDTVPQPYPVVKEVPADLTWWQTARIHLANILLWVLAIMCGYWVARRFILKR